MTASRPNATDRGYDAKWRRNRARFLKVHRVCVDCGGDADVADHAPRSRKELIAAGEPHPDAWKHLQPRCRPCHSRRTGREEPGGWNAWERRRRAPERHPGLIEPPGAPSREVRVCAAGHTGPGCASRHRTAIFGAA